MTQDGDSRDERSCLISSGNRYAIVKFCIWSSASFKAKQRAIDLKLLLNSKSKLHGFDSIEGLPENWLPHRQKGYFATHGEIPQIDDNRVTFFKGWFDQTLRTYKCPPICALNALKKSGPVVIENLAISWEKTSNRISVRIIPSGPLVNHRLNLHSTNWWSYLRRFITEARDRTLPLVPSWIQKQLYSCG